MENQTTTARQVLALKYRPKRFEDLIGQDTISTTLSLALDTNRLSHAYLFSGLRGSGKTSTARIMAKAFVCKNAPTSKPCEVCDGCRSANENRHLDIIEMDAASNRGIDDIKDLIEHTKYKPTSAKYKVFIIDEVHMLTTQAFNALLKTLEEPPEFVKFILATTDPLKLPATILSRTQHFRFKRISDKNIVHHLSHILNLENISFETEALDIITRSGQGSLRDTLTLLDQSIIFSKGIITTASVTDMLGMIDPIFMDNIIDVVLNKGDIKDIIESLESYEIGQVLDEITIYLKQKMLLNDKKFELYMFDRFFRIIADSKHLLNLNSDSGFVLILTLSKMIEAINIKTIEEVIEEVENIKIETPIIEKTKVQIPTKIVQKDITKVENTVIEHKKEIEVEDNESLKKFKKLTESIYNKSYDFGECFENNFHFSSYKNNILKLNSIASGDCRTLLYKNFSHIKYFVSDIFGTETELEFEKIQKEEKKDMVRVVKAVPNDNNDLNSSTKNIKEENYEQPSSCVASMSAVVNPTLSQKELNIDDVLNSKMVNTAIGLFQSKNTPKIKSKL
ncbi:MAG: DNA polymerase III subunit gamma/tau [Campylobacterota bacterium]|nr:DNA polymerase III subunit gamma/tau [Campylobacterota bacterium]